MVDFSEKCKKILCPKAVVIALIVIVLVVGVMHFVSPSITDISHVYVHNPGECHLDQECISGQICFRECPEFDKNGICQNQPEIGDCTSYCSTDRPCAKGTCTTKLLWQGNSGTAVNICI